MTPHAIPGPRECVQLGSVDGVRRWVSYGRRRRMLVVWIATDGRPAVPVEIPLGQVCSALGISGASIATEARLWEAQNP